MPRVEHNSSAVNMRTRSSGWYHVVGMVVGDTVNSIPYRELGGEGTWNNFFMPTLVVNSPSVAVALS